MLGQLLTAIDNSLWKWGFISSNTSSFSELHKVTNRVESLRNKKIIYLPVVRNKYIVVRANERESKIRSVVLLYSVGHEDE